MTDVHRLVEAALAVGVVDRRVLEAVRAVRRATFVPPEHAAAADEDRPVPIPHQQVTTQPSLSARMIQALALTGDEHVLEIGTGLGYQAALLAALTRSVTSIERWPDLADQARANLAVAGVGNVTVADGDGSQGVPAAAPYDAVVMAAAYPEVPPPLVDQLRPGGRLVAPIGPGGEDMVILFDRTPDGLVERERLLPARFVRLHGRYGYPP